MLLRWKNRRRSTTPTQPQFSSSQTGELYLFGRRLDIELKNKCMRLPSFFEFDLSFLFLIPFPCTSQGMYIKSLQLAFYLRSTIVTI